MAEIKVGEYIRYDDGTLIKVIEEEHSYYNYLFKNKKGIFKHSFDIKELVQAGDLIKIPEGIYEVIFDESYEKLGILVPNKMCLSIKHSTLEYIFSEYKNVEILTKEQFEKVRYIVEG